MVDILIPKKNIIFDATVFTTLQACARKEDYRFNHHLTGIEGKSNALECGSIMHVILEEYYKSKRDNLSRTDSIDRAMKQGMLYIKGCPICIHNPEAEKLEKICQHDKGEFLGVQNTPEESTTKPKRIGWSWVLETATQYFDHYKNDSWVPIEVEHVKGEVIYEDDEIRVLWKAKYDLISDTNNGMYPIDHKTAGQNRDTSDLNNQFMGQAVLMKVRTVIVNKIGWQTSMKPAEKFNRITLNYSIDRLTEWSQEIVPFYAKMYLMYNETGIWPPNFTQCESKFGFCEYKGVCEVDRGMRNEELKLHFVTGKIWDIDNV